jgi:hypothetical protein
MTPALRTDAQQSTRLLGLAALLTVALWFVPFVSLVLFPVRAFATLVHELWHAAGALLTLGRPLEIEVYWDGSGLTTWVGGTRLIAQAAGYVCTPFFGALLLLATAGQHFVRPALLAVGTVLLVAVVTLAGNALSVLIGLGFGVLFLWLATRGSNDVSRFVLAFLGLQCMLDGLGDLRTLFFLSLGFADVQTDAHLMAEASGGWVPAPVWAVAWAGLALAVLTGALWWYYRLATSPAGALVVKRQ